MKKKVLSILLIVVMLLSFAYVPIAVQAIDVTEKKVLSGECGETVTWKYDVETKTLTASGTGKIEWKVSSGEVERNARKLIIGEGITIVGEYAFSHFSNLSEIELPKTLKNIEPYAFYGCSIKTITIPKRVTKIGNSAFGECFGLKEMTILGNVNSKASFLDEGQTVKLNLAGFCRPIGIMSVYNSLSINLMDGNDEYVMKKSFIMSPDRKHLYLYKGKSKKKRIAIPDSIEVVEPGAISWASNIKMGKNIKRIKEWGFYYCYFKTLKLPKNLKRIDAGGFSRTNMDKIIINKKLKYIGTGAFDDTFVKVVRINRDIKIKTRNFPNAKLKYTGKAKMKTIVHFGCYWDRQKQKDKIKVEFLKVIGAKGYRIKITQPDREVCKIFDTQSKKGEVKLEVLETKNSAFILKNFTVKQKEVESYGTTYQKGYTLYVQIQPYKKIGDKKLYGKWSSKMRLQIDDGFWFDAY